MMGPICWSLTLPLMLGAAQDDLPAKWIVHAPKEGSFSVHMPSMPATSKKKAGTPAGQFDFTIAVAEGRNDSYFVVSYCDFPAKDLKPETIEKRLEQACIGAEESSRGKIRTKTVIKLDSHPGRELAIEKDGALIAKMRIYLVERRLYQVMVLGSGPIFSPKEKDVGTFLDSFRLVK